MLTWTFKRYFETWKALGHINCLANFLDRYTLDPRVRTTSAVLRGRPIGENFKFHASEELPPCICRSS